MSVKVTHLNADSTFLLTFDTRPFSTVKEDFSILIDPWLSGDLILNPFATTRHKIPASISHLSEILEPDLIIISQPHPDHCHKDTLRQLRPESKTVIAAEPKAAKAIRKWDHFNPAKITELSTYDPRKKRTVSRFYTATSSVGDEPGEVTVAYIPRKADTSGYHNAIGITYQPPTSGTTGLHSEQPRPLSIIYTPHGVQVSDLSPYIDHYLRARSAIPLTLLMHSFSRVGLPWYMGAKKILYGANNGVVLARYLKPEVWLSVHDEDKDSQGLAGKKLINVQRSVKEVGMLLCPDQAYWCCSVDERCIGGAADGSKSEQWKRDGRWVCEIKELAPGDSTDVRVG